MSTFQKKGGIFSLSFFCCIYSFLAFTLHFTLLSHRIHSFLKYSPFKRPVWGFLTLILDISIFLCMWRPELCMCRPELWSKYWIKKPKMWDKQFTLYFQDIFFKNFSMWSISSHQLWAGKLISGLYIAFPLFYIIFYIILRLLPCMLPPPSNQCMDPSDFVTTNFLWFFCVQS